MSKDSTAVNPLLLWYREGELEREFRLREADRFSVHLPTVIFVLAVMNITRIILYSVDNKGAAELGWGICLLVVSLSLRCLLWVRTLKFLVIVAAEVCLYLTCVEWIISFSTFFCFQVRALILALGMVNVYTGMFLFAWGWFIYVPGLALGTVYLILRTNLYFDSQDIPAEIFTALLPAVAVYLHQRTVRDAYVEIRSRKENEERWESVVTNMPGNVVLLDLQSCLYVNPSANSPSHRFEDSLRELLTPAHASDSTSEAIFTLTRPDGSQHFLQLSYRLVPWVHRAKAVAVSFTNVTRMLNSQLMEGKTEVMSLMTACAKDMIKPGAVRTSGELKLKKRGGKADAEGQLLSVFYGLYCIEDLQRVLSGADLKPSVKSVTLPKEMKKIKEMTQSLFEAHQIAYEYRIAELPDVVKLDYVRFRQFLSLILQALVPCALKSSKLQVTVSPKTGLISNELLISVTWTQDSEKPLSELLPVAEKLAKKLGNEGLKVEPNRVQFSFFAGFLSESRQ